MSKAIGFAVEAGLNVPGVKWSESIFSLSNFQRQVGTQPGGDVAKFFSIFFELAGIWFDAEPKDVPCTDHSRKVDHVVVHRIEEWITIRVCGD